MRRTVLLGTPLILAVLMLFHPSPCDDVAGELYIGAYAWIVALVTAAVALYRAGAPRTPLALLVLPANFLGFFDHAFPFGTLTFGIFFVIAAWLELASGRLTLARQPQRVS